MPQHKKKERAYPEMLGKGYGGDELMSEDLYTVGWGKKVGYVEPVGSELFDAGENSRHATNKAAASPLIDCTVARYMAEYMACLGHYGDLAGGRCSGPPEAILD